MAKERKTATPSRQARAATALVEEQQDQRLITIFEVAQILAKWHDLGTLLPKLLACMVEMWEAADAGILNL